MPRALSILLQFLYSFFANARSDNIVDVNKQLTYVKRWLEGDVKGALS